MGSKICDVGVFRGGAVIGFAARTEVIPMLGDCPDFEEAAKEGDDINPAPGRPSPAPANAVSRIEAGGLFPISSLLSSDKLPACHGQVGGAGGRSSGGNRSQLVLQDHLCKGTSAKTSVGGLPAQPGQLLANLESGGSHREVGQHGQRGGRPLGGRLHDGFLAQTPNQGRTYTSWNQVRPSPSFPAGRSSSGR